MRSQCYLPPGRGDITAFTTANKSWYSIQRPQRDARLSWPSWLGHIHIYISNNHLHFNDYFPHKHGLTLPLAPEQWHRFPHNPTNRRKLWTLTQIRVNHPLITHLCFIHQQAPRVKGTASIIVALTNASTITTKHANIVQRCKIVAQWSRW